LFSSSAVIFPIEMNKHWTLFILMIRRIESTQQTQSSSSPLTFSYVHLDSFTGVKGHKTSEIQSNIVKCT
jgi:hypothetical protein